MKILITGGQGQVAYDIRRVAEARGIAVVNCSRGELDVTLSTSIEKALDQHQPTMVVNSAATRAVDHAECEPFEAYNINHEGAKQVAIACHARKIPLIHLSTNYVFNGKSNKAYKEDDEVDPINVYGKSKWLGELAVEEYCQHYLILRVSGIFGVHGANFLKTILKLAKDKEVFQVVSDQIICPTSSVDIAEVILQLADNFKSSGIYHYCSHDEASWYDFSEAIVAEAKQYQHLRVKKIEAIKTEQYPLPAQRPAYSVLDCTKINTVFGIQQDSWRSGLSQVIKELLG